VTTLLTRDALTRVTSPLRADVSRRRFISGTAAVGGALLLGGLKVPAAQAAIVRTMHIGVDITVNTSPTLSLQQVYQHHRATYKGQLGGRTKFFSPTGIDRAYHNMAAAWSGISDERRPRLCFKSWDLAAFNVVMDNMTSTWDAVYYQEPQDNGASGVPAAQPAEYQRVYAAMDQARAAHPNGHYVWLLKDLGAYRETSNIVSGYTWKNYDGGQKFNRMLVGGDCYSPKTLSKPRTSAYMFQWLVDWRSASGIPFTVAEFGVAKTLKGSTFTQAQRASVIQGHLDWLRANECRSVNYWCDGDTGDGDWSLEGTSSLNVWLNAMGR
jgi:hypothetical protein